MVKEVQGDLIELGARRSGSDEIREWEQRRFYAELLGLAEERRYAAGWAAHQFKQKFKHWPNGFDRRGDVAVGFNPKLGEIATDRLREGETR